MDYLTEEGKTAFRSGAALLMGDPLFPEVQYAFIIFAKNNRA